MASPFSHEPPGFDIDANRGPAFIYFGSTMIALSAIAVGLRFLSKRLSKMRLNLSDCFILIALPFAWLPGLLMIACVRSYNFGKHVEQTSAQDNRDFWQFFYISEIIYPVAIAIIKISMLLYYWRLFQIASFRIALVITGVLIVAWAFASVLVIALSCNPAHAFWDRLVPHTCIDAVHYYIGQAIPNTLTYLAIIILPLSQIRTLQVSKSRKLALAGIFTLGLFVMVIPTLRLRSIIQSQKSTDFTYDFVDRAIWTALETNIALICASLPSMDPLLQIILLGSLKPAVESPKPPEVLRTSRNGSSHISSTRTTWHDRTRSPELNHRGYACLCVSSPESLRPWSCSAASVLSRKALDSPCASDAGTEEMTIRKHGCRTLSHTSIAEDESIAESGMESGLVSSIASRTASRTVSRTPSRTPSQPVSIPASRPASRTTSRPASRPTSRTASRTVSRTASRAGSRTSRSSHMQLSRIVRQ